MSDLISRSALIEAMEKPKQCVDYGNALWSKSEIESIIENAPTVEAKPVVHGGWIKEIGCLVCSECGEVSPYREHNNFCSNCGADMRGGKHD